MKKAIAIILLLLYIVSSSGVALRAHYCCGKLRSVHLALSSGTDKDCKKGCCTDRLAFYKVDDTRSATTVTKFHPSFDKIYYQASYLVKSCFELYNTPCASGGVCQAGSPPSQQDINIAICVWRI